MSNFLKDFVVRNSLRLVIWLVFTGCVCVNTRAARGSDAWCAEELRPEINRKAEAEYPSLQKLYEYLHSRPELSLHKKETSKRALQPKLHSPYMTTDAEPTIKTGIKAMTAAALELLPTKGNEKRYLKADPE